MRQGMRRIYFFRLAGRAWSPGSPRAFSHSHARAGRQREVTKHHLTRQAGAAMLGENTLDHHCTPGQSREVAQCRLEAHPSDAIMSVFVLCLFGGVLEALL